jgi:hypothetical protein
MQFDDTSTAANAAETEDEWASRLWWEMQKRRRAAQAASAGAVLKCESS